MPIDDHPEGHLHKFQITSSSIAQSKLVKLIKISEKYNLLDKLRNVNLYPFQLVNFSLCKYFKYFGRVDVRVYNVESVDKLKLRIFR